MVFCSIRSRLYCSPHRRSKDGSYIFVIKPSGCLLRLIYTSCSQAVIIVIGFTVSNKYDPHEVHSFIRIIIPQLQVENVLLYEVYPVEDPGLEGSGDSNRDTFFTVDVDKVATVSYSSIDLPSFMRYIPHISVA